MGKTLDDNRLYAGAVIRALLERRRLRGQALKDRLGLISFESAQFNPTAVNPGGTASGLTQSTNNSYIGRFGDMLKSYRDEAKAVLGRSGLDPATLGKLMGMEGKSEDEVLNALQERIEKNNIPDSVAKLLLKPEHKHNIFNQEAFLHVHAEWATEPFKGKSLDISDAVKEYIGHMGGRGAAMAIAEAMEGNKTDTPLNELTYKSGNQSLRAFSDSAIAGNGGLTKTGGRANTVREYITAIEKALAAQKPYVDEIMQADTLVADYEATAKKINYDPTIAERIRLAWSGVKGRVKHVVETVEHEGIGGMAALVLSGIASLSVFGLAKEKLKLGTGISALLALVTGVVGFIFGPKIIEMFGGDKEKPPTTQVKAGPPAQDKKDQHGALPGDASTLVGKLERNPDITPDKAFSGDGPIAQSLPHVQTQTAGLSSNPTT